MFSGQSEWSVYNCGSFRLQKFSIFLFYFYWRASEVSSQTCHLMAPEHGTCRNEMIVQYYTTPGFELGATDSYLQISALAQY